MFLLALWDVTSMWYKPLSGTCSACVTPPQRGMNAALKIMSW